MGLRLGKTWKLLTRLMVAVGLLLSLAPSPRVLGMVLASSNPIQLFEDKEAEEHQNKGSEESIKSEASNLHSSRQAYPTRPQKFVSRVTCPGASSFRASSSSHHYADSLCNGLGSHYRC